MGVRVEDRSGLISRVAHFFLGLHEAVVPVEVPREGLVGLVLLLCQGLPRDGLPFSVPVEAVKYPAFAVVETGVTSHCLFYSLQELVSLGLSPQVVVVEFLSQLVDQSFLVLF
jgi:hypothetical protein